MLIDIIYSVITTLGVIITYHSVIKKYYLSKNKKKEDNLCEVIRQWLMAPPGHNDEPVLRHKMYDKKNDASEGLKKLIGKHEKCKHDDCLNVCDEEQKAISQYVYSR